MAPIIKKKKKLYYIYINDYLPPPTLTTCLVHQIKVHICLKKSKFK